MKNITAPCRKNTGFKLAMLSLGVFMMPQAAYGQCFNKITAFNDTQHFDCTDVTVTANGFADTGLACSVGGAYWISIIDESSITFTFTTPASGVVLEFDALNNHEFSGDGHEEASIEINGVPYPFPDAGTPGCKPLQAMLTPGGNLMAPNCNLPICLAGSRDVTIMETIYTITVKDLIVANSNFFGGINFAIYFCCYDCSADAGTLNAPARSLCPDALATVPPAMNTVLNADDILQYALYSDPNDSIGSIVLISNDPSFAFDPATMQTGVKYYLAAIAGENSNGNVNLSDPCLDFSNPIEIIWWPWPSVDFSIPSPDICPGDCVTIEVIFTGEPPFLLTYQSSLSGPATMNFVELMGTIVICAPLNAQAGSALVQATQLTDKHCTCN